MDWHFLSLEMDLPSRLLGEHFRQTYVQPPEQITLPERTIVSRGKLIRIIEEAIPDYIKDSKAPTLCFSGHGEYHHYTYGLCKVLADRRSKRYGYVHIDHHHDMWDDSEKGGLRKELHCGRFVKSIRANTNASHVLTVGTQEVEKELEGNPAQYHHIPNHELEKGLFCIDSALQRLPDDVYVSIDLDFLSPKEISTGWPEGSFKKETLFCCLELIKERKRLVGVDVCGWDAGGQYRDDRMRYLSDARKAISIHHTLAGLILSTSE